MALLPNDKLEIFSHKIKGPMPKENDTLTWIIEFEDVNNTKYGIKQKKLVRPKGLKDLEYTPYEK